MENAGARIAKLRRGLRGLGAGLAHAVMPPACLVCGEDVSDPHGMCRECWLEMKFISGTVCDGCGRPVDVWLGDTGPLRCADCVTRGFQWKRGRAAALYEGSARALILSLKHGDRPDLAPSMARWMARAAGDVLAEADVIMPVPLHWTRLVRRRLNQSAELSRGLAALSGAVHMPGVLRRVRATDSQKGRSYAERFRNVSGAFGLSEAGVRRIEGQRVVLVDDVMTTGATLNAASRVLCDGAAAAVDVVVFARVAKGEAEAFDTL